MFDRLKQAFSGIIEAAKYKTLDEKEAEALLEKFRLKLLESDVAYEVADKLLEAARVVLVGAKAMRGADWSERAREELRKTALKPFAEAGSIDLKALVESKQASPYIIVFLGINGTGKTTSIAKVAYLVKSWGHSVVLACADTFRAGAIEQLSEHARRLQVKMVAQHYGADPAAVARDAIDHARSTGHDVVLIDTAGRMQTKRNLMDEMAKIVRVSKPNMKIFVGDALAGNDAMSQAAEFLRSAGFDGIILCKADADVKGGAALSIVYATGKPIVFFGTGQGYGDLTPFNPEAFVDSLLA